MSDPIHLHWLWRQGPPGIRNVILGTSLCGHFNLLRENITVFRDDANCKRCLELAAENSEPEILAQKIL